MKRLWRGKFWAELRARAFRSIRCHFGAGRSTRFWTWKTASPGLSGRRKLLDRRTWTPGFCESQLRAARGISKDRRGQPGKQFANGYKKPAEGRFGGVLRALLCAAGKSMPCAWRAGKGGCARYKRLCCSKLGSPVGSMMGKGKWGGGGMAAKNLPFS